MKTRFLFPHSFKKIGWIITLPTLVVGIFCMVSYGEFTFMEINLEGEKRNYLFADEWIYSLNEILSLLLIIGLLLIAFSKEKIEDEFVSKIRLESLQMGVYINSAVLVLAIIFIYGDHFFTVMTFNLFTVLIFFIIRFHYIIYIKPAFDKKNKINAF